MIDVFFVSSIIFLKLTKFTHGSPDTQLILKACLKIFGSLRPEMLITLASSDVSWTGPR